MGGVCRSLGSGNVSLSTQFVELTISSSYRDLGCDEATVPERYVFDSIDGLVNGSHDFQWLYAEKTQKNAFCVLRDASAQACSYVWGKVTWGASCLDGALTRIVNCMNFLLILEVQSQLIVMLG